MVSPTQKNYAVAFLDFAKKNLDRVAIVQQGDTVSYAALARLVMAYSLHLHVRGVSADSRIAIYGPTGVDAFALALAANALGASWAHIMHPVPMQMLQPTHNFLIPSTAGETREGMVSVDMSWASAPRGMPVSAAPELRGFSGGAAPAVIATTSGTTGTPKLVLRSAAQVYELMRRSPLDAYAGVATTFPLTMMFGFRVTVATLLAGRTIVAAGNFQRMQADGADALFGSPVQVDALLGSTPHPERRMALLHVGGATVSRQQLQNWQNYFERIEIAYGSREAGDSGHVVLGFRDTVPDTLRYTLHDDVRLEIVDASDQPVAGGATGHVRLRTPAMAFGYYNDAAGSAQAFRNGWFYPGDDGRLDADGRLEIVGRDNEVVNIRGVKIGLPFVDASLQGIEGVGAALSYVLPGESARLGLYVRPSDPASSDAALQVLAMRVRDIMDRRLGHSLRPEEIYFVEALPINDAGKAVRSREARSRMLGKGAY